MGRRYRSPRLNPGRPSRQPQQFPPSIASPPNSVNSSRNSTPWWARVRECRSRLGGGTGQPSPQIVQNGLSLSNLVRVRFAAPAFNVRRNGVGSSLRHLGIESVGVELQDRESDPEDGPVVDVLDQVRTQSSNQGDRGLRRGGSIGDGGFPLGAYVGSNVIVKQPDASSTHVGSLEALDIEGNRPHARVFVSLFSGSWPELAIQTLSTGDLHR
jgi:hypothetical protein